MKWLLVIVACALLTGGCKDGSNLAPVSGQVKLNGKPLPNAHVTFQPTGATSVNVGVGSVGVTDEEGRYTLETIRGQKGAVIGAHIVSIRTNAFREAPTSDTDAPGSRKELLPARYNDNTQLAFTVPAGGTDQADFVDLKSP